METIILPGYGTPVTLTVPEDTVMGVRADGRMLTISLKANTPTRVDFLKSRQVLSLVA